MAQQVVELTSDEAKLLAGINRLIDQQNRFRDKLRQTGDEAKKAGDKVGEQGDASQDACEVGIGGLAKMAAGYLTVNAAIGLAVKLLNDQREAADAAGKAVRSSEFKQAELVQLVTGDTAEERNANFKKLTDTSESLFASGVGKSVDEAADVLFNMISAGVGDELNTFRDLAATGAGGDAGSVADLAKGVATLVTTLGKDETGTARSLIGKALAAAEIAPGTVSGVMSAAARGGGTAKALGISDEELLAATALVSASTGSTEMGGTQVASFLKSLDKKGEFKGKSLADSVAAIDAMGMSGEQLFEYLGTSEAVGAYRTLSSNRGQYEETLGKIGIAAERDTVGERLQVLESDPEIAAARAARVAEAEKTIGERQLGTFTNEADAAQAAIVAQARANQGNANAAQRYLGGTAAAIVNQGIGWQRWFMGDEAFLNGGITAGQNERIRNITGDRETTERPTSEATTIAAPGGGGGEVVSVLKDIRDTNSAMAKGNNNAAANSQAGRHIE